MCELKIAQLKRAYILSTNPSIGGEGRVCTIAKWWDLDLSVLCVIMYQHVSARNHRRFLFSLL